MKNLLLIKQQPSKYYDKQIKYYNKQKPFLLDEVKYNKFI